MGDAIGGGGESVTGGTNHRLPLVCTISTHLISSTITVYVHFHMATIQRNTISLRIWYVLQLIRFIGDHI